MKTDKNCKWYTVIVLLTITNDKKKDVEEKQTWKQVVIKNWCYKYFKNSLQKLYIQYFNENNKILSCTKNYAILSSHRICYLGCLECILGDLTESSLNKLIQI